MKKLIIDLLLSSLIFSAAPACARTGQEPPRTRIVASVADGVKFRNPDLEYDQCSVALVWYPDIAAMEHQEYRRHVEQIDCPTYDLLRHGDLVWIDIDYDDLGVEERVSVAGVHPMTEALRIWKVGSGQRLNREDSNLLFAVSGTSYHDVQLLSQLP